MTLKKVMDLIQGLGLHPAIQKPACKVDWESFVEMYASFLSLCGHVIHCDDASPYDSLLAPADPRDPELKKSALTVDGCFVSVHFQTRSQVVNMIYFQNKMFPPQPAACWDIFFDWRMNAVVVFTRQTFWMEGGLASSAWRTETFFSLEDQETELVFKLSSGDDSIC